MSKPLNNTRNRLWITLLLTAFISLKAVASGIERIEPSSWWIGFENPQVQLLVKGKNIAALRPEINYTGVEIKQVISTENPNYLFIDVVIHPNAKPGEVPIIFKNGKKTQASTSWEIEERAQESALRQGFDSSDAMYLVMPDRFSNGNPDNDDVKGMKEKANRNEPYGRHGGDLLGIQQNLDFIADLGFTALWINPVQENDQPHSSYHGYAITDFYNVDRRFGSNEDFKQLVKEANNKGIKIIMDMVFNHCGSEHWWMSDLPTKEWINQYPEFTRSNYRLSTISDPYVSKVDFDLTTRAWFDTTMPDMNLKNELVLNYLIQNSIWWIEYSGLQGIRMDTYPYPDKEGMAAWMLRLNQEYPNFSVVGESWIGQPSKLAYWQKDFPNSDGYNSHLKGLMDFPVAEAIAKAFNEEEEGWSEGMMRLYDVLADDHLYRYPLDMVVFGENHDMGRMAHFFGNDLQKMKLATTFLATVRGIPQWYYGSEILMNGDGGAGHANIRMDFPGGWANDTTNAFTAEGRTQEQNEMVDHLTKVLNFRKETPVIHYGKTVHFIPEDNIYVYFRYDDKDAVMVILNNNRENKTLETARFSEVLDRYKSGYDIIQDEEVSIHNPMPLPAKSSKIIQLK